MTSPGSRVASPTVTSPTFNTPVVKSPTLPKPDISTSESRLSGGLEANGSATVSENVENTAIESGNNISSQSIPESGIVYDSATLRLSVKDKIKRLKQGESENLDGISSTSLHPPKKALSLPKNARLPDAGKCFNLN